MKPWVSPHSGTVIHYLGDLLLNECCECSRQWMDAPFGFSSVSECPGCGSLYWRVVGTVAEDQTLQ